MELTEDAKKLIEVECNKINEQSRSLLREVEVYKWAARVFFTLVLGGSLIGVFKLQDYLDDRITKRTESLERLFYAKSLADGGQAQDALPELIEFAQSSSSTSFPETVTPTSARNMFGDFAKANPSIRSYFFGSLLDVLVSIPNIDPQSASFGRTEWDQLMQNTRFQIDARDNPRSANDMRYLNRMGIGLVKFANSLDEAKRASSFFEQQIRYRQSNIDVAAPSFALAMLSMADGQIEEAVRLMSRSNMAVPDWVKSPAAYFSTNDKLIWLKFYRDEPEFRDRYDKMFLMLTKR